jgi:integrase/recombinase XerD
MSHHTNLFLCFDLKSCAVGHAWLPLQTIDEIKKCGRRDSNPGKRLGGPSFLLEKSTFEPSNFETYLKLREVEGITLKWYRYCRKWITQYLDFVRWKIDENETLDYLMKLKARYSTTFYRKQAFQIRRFLEYMKIDWASTIKLPPEPEHLPKRVSPGVIEAIRIQYAEHQYFKQIKAIVLLGSTSGLRAQELYQLNPGDIDLENRIVRVNHNPQNGQTTKTQRSRVSFFTVETQKALSEYLEFFNNGSGLEKLFAQTHILHLFRATPILVKDLRKFFSQEWDRRGGPTSIKKILMGHSLKGDVDLMHYNCQSEEDLKAIYDKVMNDGLLISTS